MSADPLRLDDVLESVADGTAVDWEAAESAATESERKLLRHLRLVAGIAEVHRTVPIDDVEAPPSPVFHPAPAHALPRWGHLVLLERVGEGAFGEVYRARDPWLDRQVALKLLKPSVTGPSRLMTEAQALARVRHANVVTVHGADMHEGRVGLWMEFVHGRTLSEIVTTDGPFSAAEAMLIGEELCKALAAVHASGLIHRDIKAQNVMREAGGRLVLMDFGAGHTPLYMAPEMSTGGEATVATDIYALGVLLYYLASGKHPVVGASVDELKNAHARGERRRLAEVRPDLPDRFTAVVERALSPDPQERFATAAEMYEALRPHQRGVRVGAWAATAAAVVVVVGAGTYITWRARESAPAASNAIRIVALLPLRAEAAGEEYFASGMTEALMQELSRVGAMRVISRTSVDRARAAEKTLPDMARALHADAVLEGSVNMSSENVRVNLRLIHAGSDTPVWARTFEEPQGRLFELQQRVARSIAEELAVKIGAAPAAARASVDPSAVDDYLRGRAIFRSNSLQDQRRAAAYFESAIRKDPAYADAYASLAHSLWFQSAVLNVIPLREGYSRARELALRAVSLDPSCAQAHYDLAEIAFHNDWDWPSAEREYVQALASNPSLEAARESYAMFLMARGRTEDALAQMAEARRLDPLSPLPLSATGVVYRYARNYAEALNYFDRALAMQPRFEPARIGMGRTLNAAGRHADAIAMYEGLRGSISVESFIVSEVAQANAALGHRELAERGLQDLERLSASGQHVPALAFAFVHARLGNLDAAFGQLSEAFINREPNILWLNVDPRFDPLRADPRFNEYRARLEITSRIP